MSRDSNDYWSDDAAQYKKDGEMYSKVEYDHKGNPVRVRVAQDQLRKGEFDLEGNTAVYDPHGILTLPEAGDDTIEYVKQLSFVDSVDMSALEES